MVQLSTTLDGSDSDFSGHDFFYISHREYVPRMVKISLLIVKENIIYPKLEESGEDGRPMRCATAIDDLRWKWAGIWEGQRQLVQKNFAAFIRFANVPYA